ncbi:helix-turn-helix domain-containing protein [Enterococcus faecalis]|uniref:helix-turn-helix domain-containing protein n=1 Tax=Enterococcus faecalis TaxID=1351 RepID=UPI002DB69264|nr:helix-turn-helix domain-containing protein [Enterococcus faecalis]MEB7792128.1 helix-turn-helix domain-containing protein [Enterococcus faecalis]MEB7810085.1 helix-turn-helix domain-containing protein [Enterococcus faecalis]
MIHYFLTQKQQQVLKILYFILNSYEGVTTAELMNEFDVNRVSLSRYLKVIEDMLKKKFPLQIDLKKNEDSKLVIEKKQNISIKEILDAFQLSFMEESTVYIVLIALIQKNYSSVKEMAQDLNFGLATMYSILRIVKKMLKGFDITLDFSENDNFKGNEINIRCFIYMTFEQFPINNVLNSFEKNQYIEIIMPSLSSELSYSHKTKLHLMADIAAHRLTTNKKPLDLNNGLIQEIYLLCEEFDLSKFKSEFIDSRTLKMESLVFDFFSVGLILGGESFEKKEKIVSKYQNSQLTVANDVSSVLNHLRKEANLQYTYENYTEAYYSLLLAYLNIKYFHFETYTSYVFPIQKCSVDIQNNQVYKEVECKLVDCLKVTSLIDFQVTEVEWEGLIYLMFSIYEKNREIVPLYIYIKNNSTVIHSTIIRNKLLRVFNNRLISFCNSAEKADIIISDSNEIGYAEKTVYFENIYTQNSWKYLIQIITDCLYLK